MAKKKVEEAGVAVAEQPVAVLQTKTLPKIGVDRVFPMSHSRLTAFKKSPLHLIQYIVEKKEPTVDMKFGSAFHCITLEPDEFDKRYYQLPELNLRTNEGKAKRIELAELNKGKTEVHVEDYDLMSRMRDAVYNTGRSKELIDEITEVEKKLSWIDDITLVGMRGVLDGTGTSIIVDLKKCNNAAPKKFQRDFFNYDYHRQGAIYYDASITAEKKQRDVYFIAVEDSAPFGISVHKLPIEVIEAGREQYRKYLLEVKQWVDSGMPYDGYEYWSMNGEYEMMLPKYYVAD